MFLDEKRAASLITDDLLQLAVAALSLGDFLLNSSSTSSLASDTFCIIVLANVIDADLMNLLNICADGIILLGPLGASFLEAACIAGSPLRIVCLLAGYRVGCGLALA